MLLPPRQHQRVAAVIVVAVVAVVAAVGVDVVVVVVAAVAAAAVGVVVVAVVGAKVEAGCWQRSRGSTSRSLQRSALSLHQLMRQGRVLLRPRHQRLRVAQALVRLCPVVVVVAVVAVVVVAVVVAAVVAAVVAVVAAAAVVAVVVAVVGAKVVEAGCWQRSKGSTSRSSARRWPARHLHQLVLAQERQQAQSRRPRKCPQASQRRP